MKYNNIDRDLNPKPPIIRPLYSVIVRINFKSRFGANLVEFNLVGVVINRILVPTWLNSTNILAPTEIFVLG